MTAEKRALRRELGFWDALTIGAGTMIGAGIFLLAGVALELSGPAAVFAYLAAGLVCVITAASAAELATGMPTSGGDYYFVSRALGPALGAISGIGIWLSLTFAIAFYLFGLGEYLSRLTPAPPIVGALIGGVLLTALNVIGAKVSGRAQVVTVLILFVILGGFSILGLFHVEPGNWRPFFPEGTRPIFATTALIFVSFLGFVKIAAVAEEIKDPARNLPRALIGSVVLVTALYVLILLVIAGIFPQATIRDVRDPLTSAAQLMLGTPGGWAVVFAGLLATASSANASIMAASRINLAMARDGLVPEWFSRVHRRLLTPHRAILVTSLLALLFLFMESLEDLAKLASVLQLYSYAALNVGCVLLRGAAPAWYRPSYRSPGQPWLQLFAALSCIGIILASGFVAQAAVVGLILLSLLWYFLWARRRVQIEHAVPALRGRWGQLGPAVFFTVPARYAEGEPATLPVVRHLEAENPRRVLVAVANPETEGPLLRLAQQIATGREAAGAVEALHFEQVPLQTPLTTADEKFDPETSATHQATVRIAERERQANGAARGIRPVRETGIEVSTEFTHDVFEALALSPRERGADLLLMGWEGSFSIGRIYHTPIQRVMSHIEADLGVLKHRGNASLRSILVPWGGGPHARLGLEIASRIGAASGAKVSVLRIVKPQVDPAAAQEAVARAIEPIVPPDLEREVLVRPAANVIEAIEEEVARGGYDLVIVGASHESRIRRFLFGSIPDQVADRAPCSVLLVRHWVPEHWAARAGERVKRWRERAGLTTAPPPSQAEWRR